MSNDKNSAAICAGFDTWLDACMKEECLNDLHRTVSMQAYEDRVCIVESILDTSSTTSAAELLRRMIQADAARNNDVY